MLQFVPSETLLCLDYYAKIGTPRRKEGDGNESTGEKEERKT